MNAAAHRLEGDLSRLRILVSNDDGILAPGLKALEKIARSISTDVWVVAPETEQSATSHSLSMHLPLRIRKLGAKRYAVSGTPTDCTLLAARSILGPKGKPFDLVLSGINRGENLGEDVTYSGTVAVAMEGTLLGIPSIALSLETAPGQKPRWETPLAHAAGIIRELVASGWPKHNLINLNFPNRAPQDVAGVRVCYQGVRHVGEVVTQRTDPRGRPYYWIGSPTRPRVELQGSDITACMEGYITVTPLKVDLTDYQTLERMRNSLEHFTLNTNDACSKTKAPAKSAS